MTNFANTLSPDEMKVFYRCRKNTRIATMDALVMMQHYVKSEKAVSQTICDSLLKKLEKMNDKEFSELEIERTSAE